METFEHTDALRQIEHFARLAVIAAARAAGHTSFPLAVTARLSLDRYLAISVEPASRQLASHHLPADPIARAASALLQDRAGHLVPHINRWRLNTARQLCAFKVQTPSQHLVLQALRSHAAKGAAPTETPLHPQTEAPCITSSTSH